MLKLLKFNNTYQNHPYKTRLLDTEIYARRKSTKGMSQYALAEKIGVSRNCIYLLECHAHIPKIETIYDIMIAVRIQCRRTRGISGKIHGCMP